MRSYSFSQDAVVRRTILVGLALLTAGLFVDTQAYAQGDLVPYADPDTPFTEEYNNNYSYRGTAVRMYYKSPAYGLHTDQFGLGLQNRRLTGDGVLMFDGQYHLNLEHTQIMGLNVGLGKRWLRQSSFSDTARIFGASFWYDGANTEIDNLFNQVGVCLESLGETWDFRLNANIPVGSTRQEGSPILTGEDPIYSGYYLVNPTIIKIDQAVSVVDFEAARRIGLENIWAFGGGYGVWEEDTDDSAFGGQAGVRGYVYDDLLMQLAVTSDAMFDTRVTFNLVWYPGRSSRRCRERHSIDDRLMEPVIRNNYIALKRDERESGIPLEYEDGDLIRVVHVASDATAPGDGSYESPFTSLDDVYGGSQDKDIILVHADSAFSDQLVVLRDNQRFLGEGGNIMHEITVKDLGPIDLPETSPGSYAGAIPVINNTTGDVVTLGAAATSREYDDDSAYSTNEVNNFIIDGGTRGIVSSAVGIGQTTIKNIELSNTTGNGIELTPYIQTVVQADDSEIKQVYFSPTIDTVTLTNIGGNGVDLNATTGLPSSTTVTESIRLVNVSNTDSTGQGVSITNNKSSATISNFQHDGGATAAGGILFTNSKGGASIANSDIQGGAGTGISIVKDAAGDSTGAFTITDTNITDTGGAAFHMNGGSSNATFTGLISQTAAGSGAAVHIEGEHTGTVNFNESGEDTGVIEATTGPGLVFDKADGTYNFNDGVELVGVTTGVDIQDSDGTITLSDALIENATDAAVRINDGEAKFTFTGQIVQNAATAGTAVDVSGEHTGSATFTEGETDSTENGNGVIVATYGDGLQFDNADGSYTFNDKADLSGNNMTAGINIQNDSAGFFTFSDARITDIGGTAFNLNGGTATVNFTGRIEQDDSANLAVGIGGGHETGVVNFSEGTTDEGVILAATGAGIAFNDADGTYKFNHLVELSGDAGIDIVDSDGAITFDDATVTDSTIVALNISGGTANVNFTGLIQQNTNAVAAVNVEGEHTGTVNLNEAETDEGIVIASTGPGLTFNQADGTYNFNHAVTLSGTAGIDIVDSDGTITFADDTATVTNSSITALHINGGEVDVNFFGLITQTLNDALAVHVEGGHTGTVNLSESTADAGVVVASTGDGLLFDGADGTYNFNDAVELSGTAVIDIDSSDGTFTFASDSSIENSAGTAFTINGGEAKVTYNGTIDSTGTGRPVEITNNTGGLAIFGGKITSSGGISVDNNSGGTFQFNEQVKLDTGTNNAVDFTNNDTATVAFSNLQITTTDGIGFNAVGDGVEDGGNVQLTGSNNTISTTGTGTSVDDVYAIYMNNVQIASSGAAFKSVSADVVENGIKLDNITGTGTFSVGSAGSSVGDGGTIQNTDGDAISLTNTAKVSLNNMLITNITGDGIAMTHSNSAAFNVTIANSNINTTSGECISLNATGAGSMRLTLDDNIITQSNAQQAVELTVGASAGNTYITMTDNNISNTLAGAGSNQEAFLMTVNGGTSRFEADGNSVSSKDSQAAFDIEVNGSATVNATVENNNFNNGDTTALSTARGLLISANDTSTVRLSLLDNTAAAASGSAPFLLNKNAGASFGVVLLETPAGTVDVPKVDEVNRRNGGSGTYADYKAPSTTPAQAGWVIEFLPDAAPLTPPITLGFSNLSEGSVPTP